MKVYSFSKQESVVNNNGNIKRYKRVVQHDGKKGIEQVEKDGKVKTRRFKVKNNKRKNGSKCKTILPSILALKKRNNKSKNAKGITKRRKKTKKIKRNKKNKTKKNKKLKRKVIKRNDKGFWERLFF